MPDGLPNLPTLSGPSLAALLPPPALLEILSQVAPVMQSEPMAAVDRLPFEIDRARRMMAPAPAPSPAATPPSLPSEGPRPGGLETALRIIAPVLAVLGSPQPSQTAAGFISEEGQRRERAEAQRFGLQEQQRREQREDRIRAEEIARAEDQFIKRTAMEAAMTGEREERAEARQEERERRVFDQQMRKTLGEQSFQANQAEIQRIWESKRDEDKRKLDKEKLDLQQQQQRNQLSQFYLRAGVKNPKIRKELVAFEMGEITEDRLSPAAIKAAQAAGKTTGGAGASSSRVMVELVNEQGAVIGQMPYSSVKFNDSGEVQGFPGATLRFPPQVQAGAGPGKPLTREDVRAALNAGKTPAELRASARTDAERKVIEAEIAAGPAQKQAPPAPGTPNALGRAVKAFAGSEPIRPSQAAKGPGGVPILR